jgi:hypothetical protein
VLGSNLDWDTVLTWIVHGFPQSLQTCQVITFIIHSLIMLSFDASAERQKRARNLTSYVAARFSRSLLHGYE